MQHIYSNDADFEKALGVFITEQSAIAINDHGYFSIAFSGGSAATKVCKSLDEVSSEISWSQWKIFFCDERFVDLTNPDSNFKAIHDGLLNKYSDIKKENVFALKFSGSVNDAAVDYEEKLKSIFKTESFPNIDLVILGMGPDGHICSLFPNNPLLHETEKWVVSIENSPKPPPQRITITMNVVNNAKSVIFITMGEGKAANIKKAIEDGPSNNIPASLVKPVNGSLHWFMDVGAASLLKK